MAQILTPLNFHTTKLFVLALIVGIKLAAKPGETTNAIAMLIPWMQ